MRFDIGDIGNGVFRRILHGILSSLLLQRRWQVLLRLSCDLNILAFIFRPVYLPIIIEQTDKNHLSCRYFHIFGYRHGLEDEYKTSIPINQCT
jgi:hypothetical protein